MVTDWQLYDTYEKYQWFKRFYEIKIDFFFKITLGSKGMALGSLGIVAFDCTNHIVSFINTIS